MSGDRNCPFCHGRGYHCVEPDSSLTYPCDCATEVDEVAHMEEQAIEAAEEVDEVAHMEEQAIEAAEEVDADSIIDDDDDEVEFKTWP